MTQPPALPPEGWYPNPANPEQQRWWDGQQWTEHVAVGAPMAPGYEQRIPPTQPPIQLQQQQPGQQQWQQPSPYAPMQQPYQYQPTQQPYAPGGYQPYPQQPGHPAQPPYGGYPAYPAAAPRGVLPDGAQVAGWWWRVLARIIDGIVTAIPTLVLGAPLIKRVYDRFSDWVDAVNAADRANLPMPHLNTGGLTRDLVLLTVIAGLVQIVYELLMLKLCAGTLGKLACGLRVRAWDARGPLSWATVGKRVLAFQVATAVPQVGGFYYLLDVLWPLWDGRKQALHDKLAGTAVVKKHDAELVPQTYGGATGFGTYQPL
jgi:uncharacterized RDD family membrane protein YckC